MRHEIIMPALGMAQDKGTLLAWRKSEGESVTEGEALFEVETDKTTMEVEAPASGFLVEISASDGDEVAVGKVIALISDSRDASGSSPKEPAAATSDQAPEADSLPPGKSVIMPVLGMSQDTGTLVAWSKKIGDQVKEDDTLFEVETDKNVVEVPAGVSGYLVARLAAEGDDVPTGETIAIINSEQVSAMVDRAYSKSAVPTPEPEQAPSETVPKAAADPVAAKRPVAQAARRSAPEGKILASPKLKRMAHQAGYNLALLAATNHPQPFHARDFEVLREANEVKVDHSSAAHAGAAINRLSAHVAAPELYSFVAWAVDNVENASEQRVIATFAGASLAENSIVRIDRRGESEAFSTHHQLSHTVESEAEPDLIVHDLRGTFISAAELTPESVPVLAIVGSNDELTVTLTCIDAQLAGKDAAVLLDNFAARLADPIRHLF